MAIVTRKSTSITNRDANPRVMTNAAGAAGSIRGFVGQLLTVATDDIDSAYIMGRVPSNAIMHSLRIFSPDIGSAAAAVDVGLYQTTENGGAVVDADFFASGVVLNAGAISAVEVVHEAAVFTLANSEKPLWSALGLTSDPERDYDVVLTPIGAIDAAVVIALKGLYAI